MGEVGAACFELTQAQAAEALDIMGRVNDLVKSRMQHK